MTRKGRKALNVVLAVVGVGGALAVTGWQVWMFLASLQVPVDGLATAAEVRARRWEWLTEQGLGWSVAAALVLLAIGGRALRALQADARGRDGGRSDGSGTW